MKSLVRMENELTVRGKRIVVAGLGRSGSAAALWLSGRGADVTVSEMRREADLDPEIVNKILGAGIRLEAGGHETETFSNAHLVVISPGVPDDIAPVRAARDLGIKVVGEMELACRFLDIPMAGVTGTNGKSTVTALIGEMLRNSGRRVFVGGNIGKPLIDLAASAGRYDCAVVEVSSYQLDTMESFRPVVSVILNITPDHLDRYSDFEAYVQSKLSIYSSQDQGGTVVLNDEDERLQRVNPGDHLRVLRYGMKESRGRAAWVSQDRVLVRLSKEESRAFSLKHFILQGFHNRENVTAAILASLVLETPPEAIQNALDSFQGLPHRLELVAEAGGTAFYNDSKATNIDAAVRAVMSFDRPLILIAGGRHKGADYKELVRAARGRVKAAVFLGEARSLLARAFDGVLPVRQVETLEEAVFEARRLARPGDIVLFSPACSSFDMFIDYEHRGKAFKDAVSGELDVREKE